MKWFKQLLLFSLFILLLFGFTNKVSAMNETETKEKIEGIINWKKATLNISSKDSLLNYELLKETGNTSVDWYVFAMARAGYNDQYAIYKSMLNEVVSKRYMRSEKLSESKATEWHRITLAYLAVGGDPTNVNNEEINLIADGVYNRGKMKALNSQGINGLTWGLIALDSMKYKVPKMAFENRQQIIQKIIDAQQQDGGFSLLKGESNIDLTAMTIQALAPYYNSEEEFSGEKVRTVIDRALEFIRKNQTDSGAFAQDGLENLETTAQVVVALTSLHIDPQKDERYIKNGFSSIDGMMQFFQPDGGFIHSKIYDETNPTSLPDESNTMATEQALYAFVALLRQQTNTRNLYDFREEQSEKIKEKIAQVEKAIDKSDSSEELKEILQLYEEIPAEERSYVANYKKLIELAKQYNQSLDDTKLSTIHSNNHSMTMTPVQLFSNDRVKNKGLTTKDLQRIHHLPKDVSTADYVEVIALLDQVKKTNTKEIAILQKRKKEIEQLQQKVNDLNNEVIVALYPFTSLTLKDEEKVLEINAKYEELSKYEQQQIVNHSDIEQSVDQIKSLKQQKWLKIIASILLVASSLLFIFKRIKNKRKQMEEQ
ncbi:prenyltransferase/squalene oxidase repeat-containing protein [Kurthia sibirica]|nr:prenyltransferase/squalene oxidase repeat-containing protein [Kurthia sibirica]GEK34413.1 hypothetical protein KSI01_19460 [Kurthia sibirica]